MKQNQVLQPDYKSRQNLCLLKILAKCFHRSNKMEKKHLKWTSHNIS